MVLSLRFLMVSLYDCGRFGLERPWVSRFPGFTQNAFGVVSGLLYGVELEHRDALEAAHRWLTRHGRPNRSMLLHKLALHWREAFASTA